MKWWQLIAECRLSLRESGVSFQLAESEDRKLEAYATINSQPRSEPTVMLLLSLVGCDE